MAEYPKDLKYTKDHEWAKKAGSNVVIGVTWYAQDSLGDVVYVELPKVGAEVKAGETFGTVESTKAVSELFAPISGKVAKVNDALSNDPSLVNREPYGGAWMIEIEPANPSDFDGLMDVAAYEKAVAEAS